MLKKHLLFLVDVLEISYVEEPCNQFCPVGFLLLHLGGNPVSSVKLYWICY